MDSTALQREKGALRHAPRLFVALLLCLVGQGRVGYRLMFRHWLRMRRRDEHPAACSWCDRITRHGNPRLPTSHGICLSCRDIHFPRLHRLVSSNN